MSIDLHIHSIFSDGTFTPAEIVHLAEKRGLRAISITDHDTISAIPELFAAARNCEIEAIPGIEFSVRHGRYNLHLLGYFFDYSHPKLLEKIAVLQEAREERNNRIIKRLNDLGIEIDSAEIKAVSRKGQTGRPHIARVLCKKGVVKNMNTAFAQYLGKDKKAYVPRFIYSAEQAVALLRECGGLAVLAHPSQIDGSFTLTPKIVADLVDIGIDGIEVYYPTHSTKIRKKIISLVKKYDLIMSGGSDYHGLIRPGTDLAGGTHFHVPYELLEDMKKRLCARQAERLQTVNN